MRHPPVLSFFGAAGTVTGSRFLLETGTGRILVDYECSKACATCGSETRPSSPLVDRRRGSSPTPT